MMQKKTFRPLKEDREEVLNYLGERIVEELNKTFRTQYKIYGFTEISTLHERSVGFLNLGKTREYERDPVNEYFIGSENKIIMIFIRCGGGSEDSLFHTKLRFWVDMYHYNDHTRPKGYFYVNGVERFIEFKTEELTKEELEFMIKKYTDSIKTAIKENQFLPA